MHVTHFLPTPGSIRSRARPYLLFLLLLPLVPAGAASALEIVPVAQSRFFARTGEPTLSAMDFGTFDVAGRHHSEIGPSTLSGDLSASGFIIDFDNELTGSESSTFSLDFELGEEAWFDLQAVLEQRSPIFPAEGRSQVALYAFDSGLADFVPVFDYRIQGEFDYSDFTVDELRRLDAGLYRLFATAQGNAHFHSFEGATTASAQTIFSATFTAVPEPASGLLAMGGLAGLAAWRQTRRVRGPARS